MTTTTYPIARLAHYSDRQLEAVVRGGGAFAVKADEALYARQFPEGYEGPTCSLCDALGHGYPGGGPCPLEMRGADDDPRGA